MTDLITHIFTNMNIYSEIMTWTRAARPHIAHGHGERFICLNLVLINFCTLLGANMFTCMPASINMPRRVLFLLIVNLVKKSLLWSKVLSCSGSACL
jgi:hypothetical protein